MLDDRSYMRDPEYRPGLSASAKLMIALGVLTALQMIDVAYNQGRISQWFVLNPQDIKRGYLWQFISFQFLHSGPMHALFNILAVWFFGRRVEMSFGPSGMIRIFLASGCAGGVLQFLFGLIMPAWSVPTIGASAGTFGLLAAFALLEPHGTIYMYVFPIRAMVFLYFALGLSAFLSLVPVERGIAHPAHLGGLLAGMAMMKYGIPGTELFQNLTSKLRGGMPARKGRSSSPSRSAPWRISSTHRAAHTETDEFISKEVDPILEKISTHGIHSLTEKERKILDSARGRMKRN